MGKATPMFTPSPSSFTLDNLVSFDRRGKNSFKLHVLPVSHTAMADQALKDERVLKGLAELLLDEGDRRLRGKADL